MTSGEHPAEGDKAAAGTVGNRRADTASDIDRLAGRYLTVINSMAEGVVYQAPDGQLVAVNPAAERILGLSGEQLVGRTSETPDWQAIHEDGTPFPGQDHPAMVTLRTGKPQVDVVMGVQRSDGSRVWISINSCALHRGSGGPPDGVVTTFRDITAQKHLEMALLEAGDREQQRIASELHDGLGQELTGLTLLAKALANEAHAGKSMDISIVDRVLEIAQTSLNTCRHVAQGLSPVLESGGSFEAALRGLANRTTGPPGPRVSFIAHSRNAIRLPLPSLDHLYRIGQEALANSLKHTSATDVRISLEVDETRVRLSVVNDGSPTSGATPNGMGSRTMRMRAAHIGARLRQEPNPAGGWRVSCEITQNGADETGRP